MNISQMMRNMIGESTSGDTRAVELKAGQVVRGVVMQLLENNEAIVQINGVQVRAKLEMGLQAGQSAILQVQPQSNGALVVLKQVDPSKAGLMDDTFRDYAKLLGLPDQTWALDIVKDLRREGFTVNREMAQLFQQAAASMPPGGDAEQWMQAAAAGFKRGLPMTTSTVAALQQVLFGQGAHQLLDSLQRQLSAVVAAGGDSGADGGDTKQQAVSRVLHLLSEGAALLRGPLISSEGGSGNLASTSTQQVSTAPRSEQAIAANLTQSPLDEASAAGNANAAQASRTAAGSTNWLGQMMKWFGVDHELQLAKAITAAEAQPQQAASPSSSKAADTAAPRAAATLGQQQPQLGQAPQNPLPSTNLQAVVQQNVPSGNGPVVQPEGQSPPMGQGEQRTQGERQQISANTSITSHNIADKAQTEGLQAQSTQGQPSQSSSQAPQVSPSIQPQQLQQESLKSALLSLMTSNDVPPAVRETAQQLVNQITGQQLLLTPERNSSMFTHVTMFIPLKGEDGNQTASVHIQTRRGRKGDLDAANCRLLFNLSMQTLGDTMVDMNVTDKIVSLNIWNDHPAIGMLTESSRQDINSRLQEAGYQLLSLRTIPFAKPDAQGEQSVAEKQPQPPDLAQFASTRYKGVDFRI